MWNRCGQQGGVPTLIIQSMFAFDDLAITSGEGDADGGKAPASDTLSAELWHAVIPDAKKNMMI
jgi:hypothetical protein